MQNFYKPHGFFSVLVYRQLYFTVNIFNHRTVCVMDVNNESCCKRRDGKDRRLSAANHRQGCHRLGYMTGSSVVCKSVWVFRLFCLVCSVNLFFHVERRSSDDVISISMETTNIRWGGQSWYISISVSLVFMHVKFYTEIGEILCELYDKSWHLWLTVYI